MALFYKNRDSKMVRLLLLWPWILSCVFLPACSSLPMLDSKPRLQPVMIPQPVKSSDAAVSDSAEAKEPNEKLLKAAGNYAGLVSLYKKRLTEAESLKDQDHYHYLLAEAYMLSGDPESALLHIDPIIYAERDTPELFLLKSKALLRQGDLKGALRTAVTAEGYGTQQPEIYNQLGLVQAYGGDYQKARSNFERARFLMIDDVTVQNNLAMLDILEQSYESAAQRLLTLYRNGHADERVKANLALSLAKSGRVDEFISIFGKGNDQEDMNLFRALSQLKGKADSPL